MLNNTRQFKSYWLTPSSQLDPCLCHLVYARECLAKNGIVVGIDPVNQLCNTNYIRVNLVDHTLYYNSNNLIRDKQLKELKDVCIENRWGLFSCDLKHFIEI